MGSRDRATMPGGPRQSEADRDRFEEAGSEIRRAVPLRSVPWLVLSFEDLRRLPLDHRDGFVRSLVDGRCTVEMLLELAGLPEDEVLRVLGRLVELGAIELHAESP